MLIDVHGHIGRIVPDMKEFIDVTNLIAKMDLWGIDRTCVLPLSEHPEGAYLNCNTEDVISECNKYPDRLIPFCLIDPRLGNNPKYDFSYLLEEYKARGCKGMGEMLPKLDTDDERLINLFRQAGKHGLHVIIDMMDGPLSYGLCDNYGLPKLEKLLQSCPETVVVGHGPTFWAEISAEVPEDKRAWYPDGAIKKEGAVPRLLRKYNNLWADLSARSGYNALTRDPGFGLEFLDEFQDKLMFATDACLRSDVNITAPIVKYFRELRGDKKLSNEAIEKMEYKNAVKLFTL